MDIFLFWTFACTEHNNFLSLFTVQTVHLFFFNQTNQLTAKINVKKKSDKLCVIVGLTSFGDFATFAFTSDPSYANV